MPLLGVVLAIFLRKNNKKTWILLQWTHTEVVNCNLKPILCTNEKTLHEGRLEFKNKLS